MALLDVGRVCRKTAGRDSWRFCVITAKVKDGFEVVGADGQKAKISASHIEPTPWVVNTKNPPEELSKLKLA